MNQQVTLIVYDATNGVAKRNSQELMGQQIDAIYHTALLVYGWEYYYGGIIGTA
jgi:desumoylating isopeptidase 1